MLGSERNGGENEGNYINKSLDNTTQRGENEGNERRREVKTPQWSQFSLVFFGHESCKKIVFKIFFRLFVRTVKTVF